MAGQLCASPKEASVGAWQVVAVAALVSVVVFAVYALRTEAPAAVAARRALRRPATWLVGAPATVLVLAVGVPFIYLRLAAGPTSGPLTFADLGPVPTTALPPSTPSLGNAAIAPAAAAPADPGGAHNVGPAAAARSGASSVGGGGAAGVSL